MLAKLLWKRIPAAVKSRCSELEKLWTLGQQLFVRDRAAVFHTLNTTSWHTSLQPIMTALTGEAHGTTAHQDGTDT